MKTVVLDPLAWDAADAAEPARVEEWLVAEGDHVHAGEPVALVRLGPQALDVRSPCAGVLEEIVMPAGEGFAPGAVLARVIET
jgi:pyruvate/2-oxoglutarate dehydrogenase complex dihydrolipoamide acyltransferase (E2) component